VTSPTIQAHIGGMPAVFTAFPVGYLAYARLFQ